MSTTSQSTTGTNLPTQQSHPHPCPSCGHCPTCGKSNRGPQPWPYGRWPWTYPNPYYGPYWYSQSQSPNTCHGTVPSNGPSKFYSNTNAAAEAPMIFALLWMCPEGDTRVFAEVLFRACSQ